MAKKIVKSKKTTKVVKKAAKKTVKKKPASKKQTKTLIFVCYDCGFDNHLTIRGEGANLSWHHGINMTNLDADKWVFEALTSEDIEFKILLNDQVFELGENRKIKKGETLTVTPKFH